MATIQELLQRGLSLQNSGRTDEAAAIYLAILNVCPLEPDANHLLGLVSLGQGDAEKAVQLIEKAIEIASSNGVFWGNLGVALRRAERIEDAITAYRRALQLDPTSSDTHFNLGKSLRLVGKEYEAEECYVTAIGLNPSKSARSSAANIRSVPNGTVWPASFISRPNTPTPGENQRFS